MAKMANELVTKQSNELTTFSGETNAQMVERLTSRVQLIQHVYRKIMIKDVDYGVIPGCGSRPALMKPGAEKLILAFQITPTFQETIRDLGNGHREVIVKCTLTKNGEILGEGLGSCSTMESKYRYRDASRKCPNCGQEAIIKGKEEFGGGWVCFKKKGGCGSKWQEGDAVIESQQVGKIENTDPADQWNTVLKMSKKRSLIDADLTVLGASDIFTQDIDENLPLDNKPVEAPTEEPKAQKLASVVLQEMNAKATEKGGDTLTIFCDIVNKYLTELNKTTEELSEEEFSNLVNAIKTYKPESSK